LKQSKNYAQMCQSVNYKVQTKNTLKSNDFKQLTVWNFFSHESKYQNKMKNLICFQRIKFLYILYKIQETPFHIIWTNIGQGPHIIHT